MAESGRPPIGKTGEEGTRSRPPSRGDVERIWLVLISLVYALTMNLAHAGFLDEVWGYYGFTYSPMGVIEGAMVVGLVVLGSALLPLRLERPSSLVLVVLFVIVYVPTVVITLAVSGDAMSRYGASLVMLGAAFGIACVATRLRRRQGGESRTPGNLFELTMLLAWLALGAVLVVSYSSVMRFSSLEEMYAQREIGASTSLWVGYAQTYFGNVISPGLIALGLVKSRKRLVIAGVVGCVVLYMINAQKASLVLPLAMYGLHRLLRTGRSFWRSSSFILAASSAAVLCTIGLYNVDQRFQLPADLLVFRTLGLPGLVLSQYLDVFSSRGFTFWSHVRGVSLLVAPPTAYVADPLWPNLGLLVGEEVYGNAFNHNANLFAWDGVAAAGSLGVLVIGAVAAVWLRVLDLVSSSTSREFVFLVTLPLAMTISNGSLFTVLLSFGGLFWLAVFWFGNALRRHESTGLPDLG